MIKYWVAAAAVIILAAASSRSIGEERKSTGVDAGKASAEQVSRKGISATLPGTDNPDIPDEINFPSSVGPVLFHHRTHIKDHRVKCVECHHQINAKVLATPHPDHLKSSWIDCKICHNGSGANKQNSYTCSACHHASPLKISDETLSVKVVVHKQCWGCHETGVGKEASESCGFCHTAKKKPLATR